MPGMATRMPAEVPQYAVLIGGVYAGTNIEDAGDVFSDGPQPSTTRKAGGANRKSHGYRTRFLSGTEHFRCRRLARPCWAGASNIRSSSPANPFNRPRMRRVAAIRPAPHGASEAPAPDTVSLACSSRRIAGRPAGFQASADHGRG